MPSSVLEVGVLRLRTCLALRNRYSAQDDSLFDFKLTHSCREWFNSECGLQNEASS
jgi:hypothetical protein